MGLTGPFASSTEPVAPVDFVTLAFGAGGGSEAGSGAGLGATDPLAP